MTTTKVRIIFDGSAQQNESLHIFPHRNLGSGDTPKVYEFKTFIFGGFNGSFCFEFACQHHSRLHNETF